MTIAEQALRNRRFAEAWSGAKTARAAARDDRSRGEVTALEGRIRVAESADIGTSVRDALAKGNDAEAQRQINRLAELNPQYTGLEQLRNELTEYRRRRDAEQRGRDADQIVQRARTAIDNRNAAGAAQEIARLAEANPQHSSLGQLRNDLRSLEASLKQPSNQPFQKFVADARTHIQAHRYADARASADSAFKAAGDASSRQQVEQLRSEIDTAEQRRRTQESGRAVKLAWTALAAGNPGAARSQIEVIAGLDPQNSELPKLRAGLAKFEPRPPPTTTAGADIARIEREAMRQFFSKDYQGAKATLQSSLKAGRTSPRIYLYLACSDAALSLLSGPSQDAALLQQARQHYAQAKPQENGFAADRQYISPRILQLLGATP